MVSLVIDVAQTGEPVVGGCFRLVGWLVGWLVTCLLLCTCMRAGRYSTKPGAEPWQDHWHQAVQVFPPFRQRRPGRRTARADASAADGGGGDNSAQRDVVWEYQSVQAGDIVALSATHTDMDMWFTLHPPSRGSVSYTHLTLPTNREV